MADDRCVRLHGAPSERIEVAAVRTAVEQDGRYRECAYVPKTPWQHLQPERWQELSAASNTWDRAASIGLVAVPSEFKKLVNGLCIGRVSDASSFSEWSRATCANALSECVAHLGEFCERTDGLQYLGISYNEPAQLTTTVNRKLGMMTGLHVDSWESEGCKSRLEARNRLCVNLGSEPRYFLFCSHPVHVVWSAYSFPDSGGGVTSSVVDYLRASERLVYRLRVEPFEAYIAPTENLIHDGSTAGTERPDLSLTLLGHFAPSVSLSLGDEEPVLVEERRSTPSRG